MADSLIWPQKPQYSMLQDVQLLGDCNHSPLKPIKMLLRTLTMLTVFILMGLWLIPNLRLTIL